MKIWIEALTGKQSILFHYIAVAMEQQGHTILFTTREYDYAAKNLKRLDRDFVSIGKYGGSSLKDKLLASTNRIVELTKLVSQEQPDLLICFPSPDAHRTAFGLGIPIIQLNDTPHAHAVAKLTISLCNVLVHPHIVPSDQFLAHGNTHTISFQGLDEVLWIKGFNPDVGILDEYNLQAYQYLVIRCEESKAAYFQSLYPDIEPGSTIVKDIILALQEEGISMKVVAFPRYPEQKRILGQLGAIIPTSSIDTLSMLYYAKAAMTGGGTMGREAALLGTPTIYTFPDELAVSTLVANHGFPLQHHTNHLTVPQKLIELLNEPRMDEEIRITSLQSLETPIDAVLKAMDRLKSEGLI